MKDIVVALISAGASILVGVLALVGVIVSNRGTKEEITKKLDEKVVEIRKDFDVSRAVTDEKIQELTREVREHNNFARRMPVVENEIVHMHEDINGLKKYHEGG